MPNLKDTDVPGSSVTARANSPAGERAVSLVVSPTRSRPSHSTVTFSKTIPIVAAAETILTRPRTFRPEYTTHLASCLSSTSPFKSHEDGLGRASSSDPTLALVDVDAAKGPTQLDFTVPFNALDPEQGKVKRVAGAPAAGRSPCWRATCTHASSIIASGIAAAPPSIARIASDTASGVTVSQHGDSLVHMKLSLIHI